MPFLNLKKIFYIGLFFIFKGILYIENEALGWRPLSKIWLDGRNQQENAVSLMNTKHILSFLN